MHRAVTLGSALKIQYLFRALGAEASRCGPRMIVWSSRGGGFTRAAMYPQVPVRGSWRIFKRDLLGLKKLVSGSCEGIIAGRFGFAAFRV